MVQIFGGCEPFGAPGRQYGYGLTIADHRLFPRASGALLPTQARLQSWGYDLPRSAPESIEWGQLMLNEPKQSWRGRPRWRHAGTLAICAALVAGVIAAVVYTGSGGHHPSANHNVDKSGGAHHNHGIRQKDIPLLAAAVTTTADSSSFDFTFTGADTSGTQVGPGGTVVNPGGPVDGYSVAPNSKTAQSNQTLSVAGTGVVDTDPYVTLDKTDAESTYGPVSLVVDDSDVWEFGASGAGVNPGTDSGPGDPLSQFAQLVESSIGTGDGALSMMGLADPYGRLDLAQNMITGATETGTGTVDGDAVTIYAVTINVENEANQAGLSPEQQTTIDQALTVLQNQDYTGTSELVSVDGAGYIREIKTSVTFASGASVVGDQTYSNFGCGGAVTPGSPLVQPAPPGCVSPDQPGAPLPTSVPTTTTTTTTGPGG
jgi:hypothetical protein